MRLNLGLERGCLAVGGGGCSEIRPISLWSGECFTGGSLGAEIFGYGTI